MRKIVTFISMVLICICGYAQTIDPVLLEEMGQRRDNEKIRVFVIMRQQFDHQQLNRSAAHFTTRAERREFVVNELKQFAESSQYDLRQSLAEMQRSELVSEPKVLWMANAIFFEATKDAILSLADRSDIMVIGFDKERNWLPDGEESQPADPTREIATNVTQVNADQVWSLGYTGQGVVVAVIDSGVNYNHLDLADHLWDGGTEFPHHGYDFVNNDNDPMDDNGHGTHCAGTVCGDGRAGSQTGMAPDATLMCVKCLGADGKGTDTQVINAMQWAVEHGCDVISMSLGGHGYSGAEKTIIRNACVNVLNAGVIASIAAGNEGDRIDWYPIPGNVGLPGGCPPPYLDPEQALNPGGLSCSVCVGAVDENDQAAYFTSHGPCDWSDSDYADYPYTPDSQTEFGLIRPDVCAPGVSIKSADFRGNNGYKTLSGTSMATPCVAGCMALMLSKDIYVTPADVCRILEETAAPLATGKSNIYGYGRVDALAAINAMNFCPLTLDSFTVNDGQGNNDGKLNAGESVTLNLTLTNDSDVALDGATMVISIESEYVTITNGTASLPHFGAGQTRTINNMFSFTLNEDAPAKKIIRFRAETFVNGESIGTFMIGVMVYGHLLKFAEVTVLNDNNGNGLLESGETANLHVTIINLGNEPALSVEGALSTTFPYLLINSNNKSFGSIEVNEQASADFNVRLMGSAPVSYTIDFSLDFVDAYQKHTNVEFEYWKKAITLMSNPVEGGTLGGGGYYGSGQSCTITASANPGYAFVRWTLNGKTVSFSPTYTFEATGEAVFEAFFQALPGSVVIGDGDGKNENLPVRFHVNYYSLSQQIYTADELNLGACEISSVSFFTMDDLTGRDDMAIYMVNTSKTSFDSNTDWIAVTEADRVFNGSAFFIYDTWTTIYFDTPFAYDGSSNIALIVDDNSASAGLNAPSSRVYSTDSNQALYVYGGFEPNFDPYNPEYSGTLLMEKNHVCFGIVSYDYTVTTSANPVDGGTVSDGGICYYHQPFTLTATPDEGYVFSNWTKNGTKVSHVSTAHINVTETAEYVANFQQVDGIAIGDATLTNSYLPAYNSYSISEQIYTADELNADACEISSVSFYNPSPTRTLNWNVYMANTDKTAFDSDTDWIPVTEADLVFSGRITLTGYGWATVYFNTPFVYDGSSNVVLVVDDNSNSYSYSFRAFGTEESQAICIYGSGIDYDPSNPSGYTGTLMTKKNQVIFGIPSYDFTVTVSATPPEGGVASGGGLFYHHQPVPLTATPNEGYVFNKWTRNGYSASYLSPYILSVNGSSEYIANFQRMEGIVVGEPTSSNVYIPAYSNYSLSQQIYTADELNMEAGEICCVSFFNTGFAKTRNWNVYMANTDKAAFDNATDWIPVTESDLVFSGSVTLTEYGWATVCFNTPFVYDGSSNVVLVVDDNSSFQANMYCRTFSTEDSQTIRIYGSGTNYDPCNPSGYTGTLMTEKNQVIFHQPQTITATSSPIEGGTVSGGGEYAFGATCILTATPNAGYYFLNWTEDGEVVSYDVSCSFTVSGPRNLVANFVEGESTCIISFDLYDSYSDGWGGNYLVVDYGNGISEQLTIESGASASFSREVATGSILALSWISGLSAYQCSFDIKFDNGVPIYHKSGPSYNYEHELTINCAVATAPRFITAVADPVEGGIVEGAGTYDGGTVVTLTAIPNEGYSFMYWKENGVIVSSDAAYSFMVATNRHLVAHFALPFTVTATANPTEGGVVDGSGVFIYGATCTLTATSNLGYTFICWAENGSPVSLDANYSFTVSSDRNLVAIFSLPLTISITTNMAEGGTATGAGTFDYGNTCTLRATPNEGYLFLNWSKNGEVVSCNAIYNFEVTENAEIESVFMPLDGTMVGEGEETSSSLPSDSFWKYTLSQQIYTPEEIGAAGTITSISYYNAGDVVTRNFDIYMVSTNKTVFDNDMDWIAVSRANRVFRGDVVMTKGYWTTIVLDTPFAYDGISNLAIIVDDNTGSYWNSMACRVFYTNDNQAIQVYSDDLNYNPGNPSEYYGYCLMEKNQMIFGITGIASTISQTIELTAGWNWFSTYVDITLINLQYALNEALPDATSFTISSKRNGQTMFNGTRWRGALNSLDVALMYRIYVPEDCEITLEGVPLNPAEHQITIKKGANWIGFPFQQSMTVAEAFAGLPPVNGDVVRTKNGGQATYTNQWRGALNELVPGVGYIYNSAATENRTFTFPTGAK